MRRESEGFFCLADRVNINVVVASLVGVVMALVVVVVAATAVVAVMAACGGGCGSPPFRVGGMSLGAWADAAWS